MNSVSAPRRLARGYVESNATAGLRRRLERTRPAVSLGVMCSDLALSVGISAALAVVIIGRPLWLVWLAMPGLVLIARGQRGAECMVHEASHRNVAGRSWVNDWITNMLAAWSVMSTVATYRSRHLLLHHGHFGSDQDPCRNRYIRLDMAGLADLHGGWYLLGIIWRLPRYVWSWWVAIGANVLTLAVGVAWHMSVWITLAFVASPAVSVLGAICWWLAFLFVLPVLRLIGEAHEHDYSKPTEFDATFTYTRRARRLVLHPHGDGFHAEHHRYQKVPHHRLSALRKELLNLDPQWDVAPTR